MTKTVREVIALLEANGWSCARIRGDHRIFTKPDAKRPIVVPGNPGDDLATGTYKSILREAGL